MARISSLRETGPHPIIEAPLPADRSTVTAAHTILQGRQARSSLAHLLPFLGPAFIACVAYIDPGNFATNIQGGAEFGYLLVWVIIASNLMAMLIQSLSAKLGIGSPCGSTVGWPSNASSLSSNSSEMTCSNRSASACT